MTTNAPTAIETEPTETERRIERIRFALAYAPETLLALLDAGFHERLGEALEAAGALDL